MNQPRLHNSILILADLCVCIITWFTFYYLRTWLYEYEFILPAGFYLGLVLYSGGWLFLHFISGSYNSLYHKSRLAEIIRSFIISVTGCFFLLFFFILKNPHENNNNYYAEFYALVIPVFVFTVAARLIVMGITKKQVQNGRVFFNAILVGSEKKATEFHRDFKGSREQGGFRISAFLNTNGNTAGLLPPDLKTYTDLENLPGIIRDLEIEEVILTVEKGQRNLITSILQLLSDKEVNIKITPDTVDIISGALQTTNVMGTPLIDIHAGLLPVWQQNIKRAIDLLVVSIASVFLFPLFLYTVIRIKASGGGSVFYAQERIGYKGRPFLMYKFRSMQPDAEKDGPQLTNDDDARITTFGKTMRKWRLDELPQFWNIIRGEMTLVGPRPERKFYIDKIVAVHPEYKYIFKVKPGITSWGMVGFGYASSVQEMIRRMQYDLLYVENVSLALDFKIMFYSLQIIFAGKGK